MVSLNRRNPIWIPVLAWLLVSWPSGSSHSASINDDQANGYRVWLHGLETTVATRQQQGGTESQPLYPFDFIEGRAAARADSTSLLAVALELDAVESRPRLLQEPDGRTALYAVSRARNHSHVAEFDTALAWYREATIRDEHGSFNAEIAQESLVVATAAGDSATVVDSLNRLLDADDLLEDHQALVLTYRYLLASADTTNLDRLTTAVAEQDTLAQGQVAFWQAFSQSWRGRWQQGLDTLLALISADGRSHGLSDAQRAWVLVAVPDLLTLQGQSTTAASMYRALADSDLSGASEWAQCQVAVLDLLDGRYLDAGTAAGILCQQRNEFPWRSYACSVAELSDELERIRKEGRENGAASHFSH